MRAQVIFLFILAYLNLDTPLLALAQLVRQLFYFIGPGSREEHDAGARDLLVDLLNSREEALVQHSVGFI